MELFRAEHQRLWRRTSVRVCVAVCLIYVLGFGGLLSFQWFTFGSANDYTSAFGNNFDGYQTIRDKQAFSRCFGGTLTDEALQEIVRDYQARLNGGDDSETRVTDWATINSILSTLYPDLRDPGDYRTLISYIDPAELTGLYERRIETIDDFYELNGYSPEEIEYLEHMNKSVKTPFRYEWTKGWAVLLSDMIGELPMVLAIFLAIVLSPLFSGEWRDQTSTLVLTTKNGWEKTALAKIGVGLAFTLELLIMLYAGLIVLQIIYLGTTGWNLPIQNIKMIAIAPITVLQAEIYEYLFVFAGALGFAGLVMLISAVVKNVLFALIASFAVVFIPMIAVQYLPYTGQMLLDLIPLVGSPTDIFRTNLYHFFGHIVWSPYLLLIVPFLIGLLTIPLTVKSWSRRMKA